MSRGTALALLIILALAGDWAAYLLSTQRSPGDRLTPVRDGEQGADQAPSGPGSTTWLPDGFAG